MTYRVFIDPVAQNEIDGFGDYATAYSEKFAREQFAHLNRVARCELWNKSASHGVDPLMRAGNSCSLIFEERRTS